MNFFYTLKYYILSFFGIRSNRMSALDEQITANCIFTSIVYETLLTRENKSTFVMLGDAMFKVYLDTTDESVHIELYGSKD